MLFSWLHIILSPLGRSSRSQTGHHNLSVLSPSQSIQSFIEDLSPPSLPPLLLLPLLKTLKAGKGKIVSRYQVPSALSPFDRIRRRAKAVKLTLMNGNLKRFLPSLSSDLSRTRAAAQWTRPCCMLVLSRRIARNPIEDCGGTTRVQTGKILSRSVGSGELRTGSRSPHELWSPGRGRLW